MPTVPHRSPVAVALRGRSPDFPTFEHGADFEAAGHVSDVAGQGADPDAGPALYLRDFEASPRLALAISASCDSVNSRALRSRSGGMAARLFRNRFSILRSRSRGMASNNSPNLRVGIRTYSRSERAGFPLRRSARCSPNRSAKLPAWSIVVLKSTTTE